MDTPCYRVDAEPFFDGYYATLDDWTEVNYLIKTLKKARDDAFGRPE